MDTRQRDEIRELARLTAHLTCAQQTFFQAEYGRHRRSPTTALVLCLLLGGFGAHELYFGRHRSGVLRLLFCWTLIPAVLALFDLPGSAARARRYNAALGQRILLAIQEGAETEQEPQDTADDEADRDDVRIGTAEYDYSDGNARLRRVSEQLAAALTLERARQVTRPGGAFAPSMPTQMEVPSDEDLRQVATTAPVWGQDLSERTPSDEAEPSRVPVLSYATAASVRRDAVRLGPVLPVDAALPTAWTHERPNVVPQDVDVAVAPEPAIQSAKRRHMQRIIVRKMALRDGKIAAEAVAERMVDLEGTDEDIEARVRQATDEARQEALRQLALTTSGEVSEAAWASLRQQYPDAEDMQAMQ